MYIRIEIVAFVSIEGEHLLESGLDSVVGIANLQTCKQERTVGKKSMWCSLGFLEANTMPIMC